MKKIIFFVFLIITLFMFSGCDRKVNDVKKKENDNMEMVNNINVIINDKKYNANLENNDTVNTFLEMLPISFEMTELNGNEKYFYMDKTLPTKSFSPKKIEAGDIMLYGNDCLVIFYKSFDTSYSYTRIGHIDNLDDLGSGDVLVKFEK